MRKLTQSVLRIIKFYLALVQTTGLIAFGYRNPEGRIIDEKCVWVWVASAICRLKSISNQHI
jgi:hypothetical protein